MLPFPIKGGKLYLYNNNPLLIYGYPGVTGMKTGQTEAAGRCLVATAERHGVRLGAIVLRLRKTPAPRRAQLLDLGFERRLPPAARARAADSRRAPERRSPRAEPRRASSATLDALARSSEYRSLS